MPRPALSISLDGVDLTDRLRPLLSTLTLDEARDSDADELELVLVDNRGRTPLPPKGAVIEVALGWEGRPLVPKGAFKIDQRGLSGAPDIMTLKARSADFTSALTARRDQVWSETTLGAVLADLAGRQGLQAKVAPELAQIPVPMLDQSRESDGAFLTRLGKRHDAVATIKSGRLLFTPIGSAATAGGRALPGFAIVRADGDQHTWEEADREKYTGVTAHWHDVDAGTSRNVKVGGQDEGGRRKRLRKTYGSEADAAAAARSEHARLARGAATFRYSLALGRPELYPEQKGRVTGFGHPEIDGQTWQIEKVKHSWSAESFVTSLDLETAGG